MFRRSIRIILFAFAAAAFIPSAFAAKIGNEFRINPTNERYHQLPRVARLADGGFVVVWFRDNGTGFGPSTIYGRRYDAAGRRVGPRFRVDNGAVMLRRPASVAGLRGGGFVVVWQEIQGSGQQQKSDAIGQRFNASGQKMGGGPFVVNKTDGDFHSSPKVAALDDGGFVVVWIFDNAPAGGEYPLYGQRYHADGSLAGVREFLVNTTPRDRFEYFTVGAVSNGFVVLWNNSVFDPYRVSGVVLGQRFSNKGNRLGAEFQVDDARNHGGAVVIPVGAGFIVTYWIGNSSRDGIFAQRYNAAGERDGNRFRVTTSAPDSLSTPAAAAAAAALDDGGFVIAWSDDSAHLYMQRYDASGKRVSSEKLVTDEGDQPEVTAYGQGFVVVWSRVEGNTFNIYGQRYSD